MKLALINFGIIAFRWAMLLLFLVGGYVGAYRVLNGYYVIAAMLAFVAISVVLSKAERIKSNIKFPKWLDILFKIESISFLVVLLWFGFYWLSMIFCFVAFVNFVAFKIEG